MWRFEVQKIEGNLLDVLRKLNMKFQKEETSFCVSSKYKLLYGPILIATGNSLLVIIIMTDKLLLKE